MAKPSLDRLCIAYRTFRAAGLCPPEAWRLAHEYLIDNPTPEIQ